MPKPAHKRRCATPGCHHRAPPGRKHCLIHVRNAAHHAHGARAHGARCRRPHPPALREQGLNPPAGFQTGAAEAHAGADASQRDAPLRDAPPANPAGASVETLPAGLSERVSTKRASTRRASASCAAVPAALQEMPNQTGPVAAQTGADQGVAAADILAQLRAATDRVASLPLEDTAVIEAEMLSLLTLRSLVLAWMRESRQKEAVAGQAQDPGSPAQFMRAWSDSVSRIVQLLRARRDLAEDKLLADALDMILQPKLPCEGMG